MASLRSFALAVVLSCVSNLVRAGSDGFLGVPAHGHIGSSEEDFRMAMGTVMGCGGSKETVRISDVESALLPMWRVLPKNQHGLVEWSMVRYLAHRYFMQQSSLLIRGFEPMRRINSSHLGGADILHLQVPSLAQKALEGKRTSNGFAMEEVVAMIATLEQLISNAEHTLLQRVYRQQRKSVKQSLTHDELSKVIEAYMVHWMMDDDQMVIRLLLQNRTLLETAFPKWYQIRGFVDGLVKNMEFARRHAPQLGQARAALTGQFSIEDAHEVVGGVTKQFASWWESECQLIKNTLVKLDKGGTGRVSLTDFYGANADGEWRFGESEAYLRELGALDESSAWKGKQVIISNYIQSASNCIAATPHYLVCCVNECEATLNELEDSIGAPVAHPEMLLELVGNMSDIDDELPKVDDALRTQLYRIAETHSGKVPLHGRLFSQWLHYVFPQECPFPHKTGTASAVTPLQFGDNYIASQADVSSHAAARNDSMTLQNEHEEAQWMSQWSEEEELMADYSMELQAPWEVKSYPIVGVLVIGGFVMVVSSLLKGSSKTRSQAGSWGAFEHKAHYV